MEFFKSLVKQFNLTIEYHLQNDFHIFSVNKEFFLKKYSDNYEIRENCKNLATTNGIDINSIILVFNSNNPNGEGPCIVADKTGEIYWYHFGFGNPRVEKLSDSIWDFLCSKDDFISKIKNSNGKIVFNNLPKVSDYIEEDSLQKISQEGFDFNYYKPLLEELFEQSDGTLKLDSFKWGDLKNSSDGTEYIELELIINGQKGKFTIEHSLEWFQMDFPEKVNKILNIVNSKYRISLVHENDWDVTHGLKLSSIEEHHLLKSKRLIVKKENWW